ncbi:hypothetical protein EWM64_g4484 [Hericium alpestre]|uniref:Uncharacterized protein n=1 Tax=Hericium alpestre TaxID=135208 RepID=A0A4Y9ZZM7_9AGAM|nr:hypothetical protein EWM64_g4484 [Hericium alpestre]
MVLSLSNVHAKRVDTENTPPPKNHISKFKKLNGRQARHIPGASRNLNAKRLPPKARTEPQRFQFTQEATPPPSVTDVEMADASSSRVENPTTHVALPRFLAFPGTKGVSNETLAALDPTFLGMPITFIRDSLKAKGPSMMKVLTGVTATPTATLPKEMDIVVNDLSSNVMPTHMMAVYSRLPTQLSSRRVTLYPVHNIVLATHCAALPALPASDPDCPSAPGASINVPVVPLCIPHPQSFPTLVSYLYTKRAGVIGANEPFDMDGVIGLKEWFPGALFPAYAGRANWEYESLAAGDGAAPTWFPNCMPFTGG